MGRYPTAQIPAAHVVRVRQEPVDQQDWFLLQVVVKHRPATADVTGQFSSTAPGCCWRQRALEIVPTADHIYQFCAQTQVNDPVRGLSARPVSPHAPSPLTRPLNRGQRASRVLRPRRQSTSKATARFACSLGDTYYKRSRQTHFAVEQKLPYLYHLPPAQPAFK